MANDLAMTVNYDPDLQISSISHVLPQAFDEGYTYDDNGNRRTSLTNSFFYDDLNKLTESTTHEYTYDDDGNPQRGGITRCLARPRHSDA
jgi:YD repeat-containing protein